MRIPLDRSYRRTLVVRVSVHDREGARSWRLRGAIDTGAGKVVIPLDVARSLGYAPGRAGTERLVAANGVFNAPSVTLSRVDVGGASATDVEAICHDLPEEGGIDALIGLSFLTRFKVAFDFDAWEMELVPRA